jgi:uncharacterized protein YbaR (Trm112 family)
MFGKKKTKLIVCPVCMGKSIIMGYNEREYCNEDQVCPMCNGDRVVYMIVEISYKAIKDANR